MEPNGVITEYQLQCSGGGQVFSRTVMGSQTTTTLSGLLPYTNYSCNITAHTSVGGGPAATTSVTTEQDGEHIMNEKYYYFIQLCCIVPSGPPLNFTISVTSHTLTLSWSPPFSSQRNGRITDYNITCSSGGSIINSTRTSSTSLTIIVLQPFTNYTCSVRAATIRGDGPPATVSGTSDEDGETQWICTVHCSL